MTARDLSTWRHLPTLKLREAARLVGVCHKTFEREILPQLKTIEVGRQRLVTVASLRAWIGEDVKTEAPRESISRQAWRDVAAFRARGVA